MTRQVWSHRPHLRLIAFLAGGAFLVCACGVPTQRPGQAAPQTDGMRSPSQHANDIYGTTSPPLLPVLTGGKAGRLPMLPFTYGPTYQHGGVLGLVISYPGCERVEGATVAETETTVKVTVLGTPEPANCIGSQLISTAAVRLPNPLGRRKEIRG